MKNPTTNPHSPVQARILRCLAHSTVAIAGAAALLLLGLTATRAGQAAASPQFRPIEQFIDAQQMCRELLFPSTGWGDRKTVRFAAVDCMGLTDKWLAEQSGGAISLGTEVQGNVIERLLPDGRAEVTVLLHTRNALTWVAEALPEAVPPWGRPLFGHFQEEVLAGAEPALGEAFFKWVFINPAPGAPLPDLLAQVILGETVQTVMISITARADGPLRETFGLPDGTPGHAQIIQVAPVLAPGLDSTLTGGTWPAEHINLKVVGR